MLRRHGMVDRPLARVAVAGGVDRSHRFEERTKSGMTKRVALVTGAGQGIGRGIAEVLGAAGFRVAAGDLNAATAVATAEAICAAGGEAIGVQADVTSADSVNSAVRTVTEEVGAIEVLVNNAGFDEMMPFLDTSEELWDRILDVNYKGVLRMVKTVLPGMLERGHGRIVSISSDAGRVGASFEAVYSGAKAGIIAFSKTLAREVARQGVTVNTVCPGPTDTPALRAVIDAPGADAERVLKGMTRAIPMRRLATPADLGAAVAFFASDAAGYITGQTLSVSGGLTMAG